MSNTKTVKVTVHTLGKLHAFKRQGVEGAAAAVIEAQKGFGPTHGDFRRMHLQHRSFFVLSHPVTDGGPAPRQSITFTPLGPANYNEVEVESIDSPTGEIVREVLSQERARARYKIVRAAGWERNTEAEEFADSEIHEEAIMEMQAARMESEQY